MHPEQNFYASSYGSFYNNPQPKYYAPFPKAPHKFKSVNNTFKKVANKPCQTTYSSQTQVRPNKFTYVKKNINPLMSKNNLLAKSSLKPPDGLKNVNKLVYENKANTSWTSLTSKIANLKNKKITQNVVLPVNDKTKSMPNISPAASMLTKCSSKTVANLLTATTIHTEQNPSEIQPPLKIVVEPDKLKGGTVCATFTKTVSNTLRPGSACNVKKSLRSIENNFNLNSGKNELLVEKPASSKTVNRSSASMLTLKSVDKSSSFIKGIKQILNKGEKHELARSLLKRKTDIAMNIARSEITLKKLQNYKASLLAKNKLAVKGRTFETTQEPNSSMVKAVTQPLLKTNAVRKTSPSFSGARKSTLNKYKVVNKNKLSIDTHHLKTVPTCSSAQSANRKTVKDSQVSEHASIKATSRTLKQKISELKLIKTSNCVEYDLTDISPEELVSMDESCLFQLSAMLKSTNNRRESLVSKSKYKLVSKNSSSKQAARMIKAKYQTKNRKSLQGRKWNGRRLSTPYKATGYQNYRKGFKNGYRKHIASQPLKFRSSQLSKYNRYKKTNFTIIGDIRYRVSRTKMTKASRKSLSPKRAHKTKSSRIIIVRGERFRMDPSGKSLKKLSNANSLNKSPVMRIDLGGKTYIGTSPGILMQTSSPQVRNLASRVLHRSIQTAWASETKKKNLKKRTVYCMFYNRFGKCNRGKDCPYVHDPSKIAVCTRFLRGTCKEEDCLFSHVESPGKMAICTYFLQGLCTNKECPYRHELLNPDAKLCRDFVRGYCSLGIKCTKAHVLICPNYFQGQCQKGASCIYPHPPQKEKKKENVDWKIITCDEKTCVQEEESLENDDYDDKAIRYFDSRSFLSEETAHEKREAESNEQKTKKFKSFPCPPKRTKFLDCPLFIPLSLDEDSH